MTNEISSRGGEVKEISRIMGIGKEMKKMATAVLSGFYPLVRVYMCVYIYIAMCHRDSRMVSNVSSDRSSLSLIHRNVDPWI